MSRPPLPETHRECNSCHLVKPLEPELWYKQATCRGGLSRQCRACKRKAKNIVARRARLGLSLPVRPLRENEICPLCCDLPHRVEGRFCLRCERPAGEDSKPELMFTRHYEAAV